jgi:hypothetical protein
LEAAGLEVAAYPLKIILCSTYWSISKY